MVRWFRELFEKRLPCQMCRCGSPTVCTVCLDKLLAAVRDTFEKKE